MAASKHLIQLGSRLRVIHVGFTMNTLPLRRTSVNSHRFFLSRSSDCCRKQDQALTELVSMRSEITKLQFDIEKMREKLENMDKALHPINKTAHWVQNMSDETKRLISEAKKTAIKLGILFSLVALPLVLFIYLLFYHPCIFLLLLFCSAVS